MKKVKFKVDKKFIILGLIIILGIFLRFYNFGDWMHWQLDQARDWRVVSAGLKYGPGELPLQGPRAAGSFLRLGPLLYYLEYFSALLFGATPIASAVIIVLLNIVSIFLFYLLLRRFFEWRLAMVLTAIFSTSIFLVTYSRFAWNPNLIPFFATLFAYALLRIDKKKGDRENGKWLVVTALAVAGISQMHFLAFVSVPVIAIIYLIWTRPKISGKYWILAVLAFLFMNTPLIINDYKTGGRNIQEFIKVVTNRSTDEKKHSLKATLVRSVELHARYNWLILSGDQLAFAPLSQRNMLRCKEHCSARFFRGIISLALLGWGIFAWWDLWNREKEERRKNFLRLIILWSGVVFVLYSKLAYDIAPRFFLLEAPLFIIFLGLIVRWLNLKTKNKYTTVWLAILLFLVFSNLLFLRGYYGQLARAGTDDNFVLSHKDYILKEKTRVTYEQMEEIVGFMKKEWQQNNYPIFFRAQPEYKTAFGGILELQKIPFVYLSKDLKNIYRQGNYFIILRSQSDQKALLSRYVQKFDIQDKKQFGTLIVYRLKPKEEFITAESKKIVPPSRNKKYPSTIQRRYLWRQIFE